VTASRRLTAVWILLLALTVGSFFVGLEQGAGLAASGAMVIVGVAMLKVRLIGVHFMDLRVAPTALRVVFEAYLLIVFVVLAAIDVVVKP
jgi:caa(3)-type oxidase subunit IV